MASDLTPIHSIIESRSKDYLNLPSDKFSYKLADGYGLDNLTVGDLDIDPKTMSMTIYFADGSNRDSVGDTLDISGVKTHRHLRNSIVLLDHGKVVALPIARARSDPKDINTYTVTLDVVNKKASCRAFFYQGENECGLNGSCDPGTHARLCAELFDMCYQGLISGGSIGYAIIHSTALPPDYATGTPQGLLLHSTLLLEVSLVVLPANERTVGKNEKYLPVIDYITKALTGGRINGYQPTDYFRKAFTPYLLPKKHQETSGYSKKDLITDLQMLGDELSEYQDPAPMPGYGQIFLNDNDVGGKEAQVWYVGGDGDEDGFSNLVQNKIRGVFPGCNHITTEAESFPPKDEGWMQVYPEYKPWTNGEVLPGQYSKSHPQVPNYREADDLEESCSTCGAYVDHGGQFGKCNMFSIKVDPEGICDRWFSSKTGEKSMQHGPSCKCAQCQLKYHTKHQCKCHDCSQGHKCSCSIQTKDIGDSALPEPPVPKKSPKPKEPKEPKESPKQRLKPFYGGSGHHPEPKLDDFPSQGSGGSSPESFPTSHTDQSPPDVETHFSEAFPGETTSEFEELPEEDIDKEISEYEGMTPEERARSLGIDPEELDRYDQFMQHITPLDPDSYTIPEEVEQSNRMEPPGSGGNPNFQEFIDAVNNTLEPQKFNSLPRGVKEDLRDHYLNNLRGRPDAEEVLERTINNLSNRYRKFLHTRYIHTKHIRHEKNRESGHQWVLYNHDETKVLGTHPSRESAVKQEQAVKANSKGLNIETKAKPKQPKQPAQPKTEKTKLTTQKNPSFTHLPSQIQARVVPQSAGTVQSNINIPEPTTPSNKPKPAQSRTGQPILSYEDPETGKNSRRGLESPRRRHRNFNDPEAGDFPVEPPIPQVKPRHEEIHKLPEVLGEGDFPERTTGTQRAYVPHRVDVETPVEPKYNNEFPSEGNTPNEKPISDTVEEMLKKEEKNPLPDRENLELVNQAKKPTELQKWAEGVRNSDPRIMEWYNKIQEMKKTLKDKKTTKDQAKIGIQFYLNTVVAPYLKKHPENNELLTREAAQSLFGIRFGKEGFKNPYLSGDKTSTTHRESVEKESTPIDKPVEAINNTLEKLDKAEAKASKQGDQLTPKEEKSVEYLINKELPKEAAEIKDILKKEVEEGRLSEDQAKDLFYKSSSVFWGRIEKWVYRIALASLLGITALWTVTNTFSKIGKAVRGHPELQQTPLKSPHNQNAPKSLSFSQRGYTWDSKSLKDLINKHRVSEGRYHRSKHSTPGSIHMSLSHKDLDSLRKDAQDKGVELHWISDDGKGYSKVKLSGMDGVIEDLAKKYAKAVKKVKSLPRDLDSRDGPIGTLPSGSRSRVELQKGPHSNTPGSTRRDEEVEEGTEPVMTAKGIQTKGMKKKTVTTEFENGQEDGSRSDLQENPKNSKHTQGDGGVQGEGNGELTPGEDYSPGAEGQPREKGPKEPYGAQVARRMHADMAGLLHEYDEFLDNLEDESTRQLVMKQIQHFISSLEQLEDHASNHERYKDIFKENPYEGMEDEESENPPSSEPTPDDALMGMQTQEDPRAEPTPDETMEGMKQLAMTDDAGVGFDSNENKFDLEDEDEDEKNKLLYHKHIKGLRQKHSTKQYHEIEKEEEKHPERQEKSVISGDRAVYLRKYLMFLGNKSDTNSKKFRSFLIKNLKAHEDHKDNETLLQGQDKEHKPGHEACEGSGMDITQKLSGQKKKSQPSDKFSKDKARTMLSDGTAHGHKLTEPQEHMLQAAAHRGE